MSPFRRLARTDADAARDQLLAAYAAADADAEEAAKALGMSRRSFDRFARLLARGVDVPGKLAQIRGDVRSKRMVETGFKIAPAPDWVAARERNINDCMAYLPRVEGRVAFRGKRGDRRPGGRPWGTRYVDRRGVKLMGVKWSAVLAAMRAGRINGYVSDGETVFRYIDVVKIREKSKPVRPPPGLFED